MAEGGLSLSVSARPTHTLEEQLSKFPAELLDSPCVDGHLIKLSQSIAEWRDLSPYLRLSPAEERGILTAFPPATPARQRIDMLRTWRDKFGVNANYRCLITSLHEACRADLIDKLQLITLQPTVQDKHNIVVNQKLNWYGTYLKQQYLEVLFTLHSMNKWLPSPSQKIFNLAIIKKEKIQLFDDEFINKTIRGQVDDILLKKSPIDLKDLFKNIKRERKVILIDGAPGSGKSTLTVHICQQWGRGELFNEFTVVILVQLRDHSVQNAHSIADLLPNKDRAMAERAAEDIKETEGKGVLWILDGWDELPSHLQKESIISTLIKPKLHRANPLSKCAVIVTSRPISSGDLCPLVSSRIEVLGFTAEEQRRFFTECLNSDTQAVETLMERLTSNPAMEGSCYLPLNATIVAYLYLTNGSLPSTIYEIFSSLVQHCFSRYLHERQGISLELASFESLEGLPYELQTSFKQLCKLAFIGAKDNKITFSTCDLEALGASKEICELGLLQAVPSIVSHGRSVYHIFLHLSIHEMLAAVHISGLPAREQISIFDSMINDARFGAVLQFYAAITKLRTSRPLLSLVPRFLRPIPASIFDLVRKIIRKGSKALLVSLLNCLYEAQDSALCKYVGEQLREKLWFIDRLSGVHTEINLCDFSLLPRDCLSIGYFMASMAVNYNGRIRISLGNCFMKDTGTKILMQSFCRSLLPHGAGEMTGHIYLCLDHNNITEKGALYIAEALKTTVALKKLDIWDNPIGDEGLQFIAEALVTNTSLIILDLFQCKLKMTEENGPKLTDMLRKNKTLRELHLSYSSAITNSDVIFIIEGLKENTTLRTLILGQSGITDECFHSLQSSTSTCKLIRYN